MGLGLVAYARGARKRSFTLAGLTLAAIGTAAWYVPAIGAGRMPLYWGAVGVGLSVVAAASWLAHRRGASVAMRAGFACLALGLVMVLVREAAIDLWPASYVVAIAGAALLAWRAPDVVGPAREDAHERYPASRA